MSTMLFVAMVLLTGCAGTAAPPAAPPLNAMCPWNPPPTDPSQPADTCGVPSTTLTFPLGQSADRIEADIELYSARSLTCPVAGSRCAVEDGRRALAVSDPDPHTDPSRSRATLVLDWQDGRVILVLPARCHLPGGAPPGDPSSTAVPAQRCVAFDPAAARLAVVSSHRTQDWQLQITLTISGDPGEAPNATVADRWDLSLDTVAQQLTLTGIGTNTPAFALLTLGAVRCVEPGAAPPPAPTPPPTQTYRCTTPLPTNP